MYQIILENKGRIDGIINNFYAETLGITPQYVSNMLTGKLPVKEIIAKGILSIAYNIPITDDSMNQLLEKHFIKVK